MKLKNVSLLGMSFLSFSEEGHVKWQGDIIGIDGDLCICQLYEWISGEESDCVVIHKMEFANLNRFRLFKSHEERNEAYRDRYQHITLEKVHDYA